MMPAARLRPVDVFDTEPAPERPVTSPCLLCGDPTSSGVWWRSPTGAMEQVCCAMPCPSAPGSRPYRAARRVPPSQQARQHSALLTGVKIVRATIDQGSWISGRLPDRLRDRYRLAESRADVRGDDYADDVLADSIGSLIREWPAGSANDPWYFDRVGRDLIEAELRGDFGDPDEIDHAAADRRARLRAEAELLRLTQHGGPRRRERCARCDADWDDPENVRITRSGSGRIMRRCRVCERERNRLRYRARLAA